MTPASRPTGSRQGNHRLERIQPVGGVVQAGSDRFVAARVQNDAHDTTWGNSGWFDVPLVGSTPAGAASLVRYWR